MIILGAMFAAITIINCILLEYNFRLMEEKSRLMVEHRRLSEEHLRRYERVAELQVLNRELQRLIEK